MTDYEMMPVRDVATDGTAVVGLYAGSDGISRFERATIADYPEWGEATFKCDSGTFTLGHGQMIPVATSGTPASELRPGDLVHGVCGDTFPGGARITGTDSYGGWTWITVADLADSSRRTYRLAPTEEVTL